MRRKGVAITECSPSNTYISIFIDARKWQGKARDGKNILPQAERLHQPHISCATVQALQAIRSFTGWNMTFIMVIRFSLCKGRLSQNQCRLKAYIECVFYYEPPVWQRISMSEAHHLYLSFVWGCSPDKGTDILHFRQVVLDPR